MLTTTTALEHLKANRTAKLIPSGKVPDQREFEILPAIGTARCANPNFTVPVIQLPSAVLPGRFADEKVWTTVERKKQHPMYSTTSHDIGFKPPTIAQLPTKWFAQSGSFSKEFMNAARFDAVRPTFTTLNTSISRNKFAHALDQGWRGDAHSSALYARTGEFRKMGSEQRIM
mmetsp:Transcript_23406/g.72927  ORF Transcript_23406/g.72927 Transcript_23406/m.72927 type:complete len:173 (+) Transcript_23406:1896-2414(+)